MAKGENGVNGPFTGPIDNITGYQRRGQQIIRKKRKKSTIPRSEKQLKQQMMMSMCNAFNKKILNFIRVGFHLEELGSVKTANNLATASLMCNSIEGNYPDLSINFSKVILTSGTLPISENQKMEKVPGGVLFSWTYNVHTEDEFDQVMLTVYPHNDLQAICILSGARRAEEKHLLGIPTIYKGSIADAWLSFIADDRQSIATSVHMGRIEL